MTEYIRALTKGCLIDAHGSNLAEPAHAAYPPCATLWPVRAVEDLGHTTASLLIAKLHASTRQNSLARALQE